MGIRHDHEGVLGAPHEANVFAGKPNPMLVGLGLGAVMVLIFALTRIVLGVLLLLLIANAIRQPRNLALTTRGRRRSTPVRFWLRSPKGRTATRFCPMEFRPTCCR